MAQLGRYTILESVGEGGMAEVFRARLDGPMGFQKTLAIKRIRNTGGRQHGEQARALINEARIGGRLRHPNIVEVYELAEEDDGFYLVMEFIDGHTLAEILEAARMQRRRLPPNVALDIAIQCCEGLAYAHDFQAEDGSPLHLVHRDLKPSNIMVTPAGVVKLMDFGIAKSSSNLFDTTDTNIAKGTPLYMSPEQLKGVRPLTASSDLWALGALLYELATGRILFRGRTVPEIITRVLNQPLQPVSEQAEQAVPGLGAVLTRLLDRDRERRFKDAREVAAALAPVLEWCDREGDTAAFVAGYRRGSPPFQALPTPPAPAPGTGAEMDALAPDDGDSPPVDSFIGEVRRGRKLRGWMGGALLLAAAAAAVYVLKGTYLAEREVAAAHQWVRDGDLERARDRFDTALSGHGGNHEARLGLAWTDLWTGARPADVVRDLEHLPEDTTAEFMAKYHAVAGALRRDGDYEAAFRYLRLAIDRATTGQMEGGPPPGPFLLWEAAECALVVAGDAERAQHVGAQDRGRAYWSRLVEEQPDRWEAEAARRWLDALDEGEEALLRAEVLYQDGRSRLAWPFVEPGLGASAAPIIERAAERLVWAYRALAEGRFDAVAPLLDPLPPLAEGGDLAFSRLCAEAASLAGLAKPEPARTRLKAALKAARNAEERATVRLQVALALRRAALDAGWAETLVRDAAAELGNEQDPDVVFVQAAGPTSLPREDSRQADPRTRRLFPEGLIRGAPLGGHLLSPQSATHTNRSAMGSAWPYGPSFHPLDGTRLSFAVDPIR